MKIEFLKENAEKLESFRGGQGCFDAEIIQLDGSKILYGTLEKGSSIGMHRHTTDFEILYVISGTATILYQGAEEIIAAGNAHYCPKGHAHTIMNQEDEPLLFFAVVADAAK